MLTSENSGKYLSKRYAEERERCARDKTQFTAAEQAFLEVSSTPHNGEADKQREAFKYCSSPADTRTNSRTLDVRDRPEVGY